MSPTAPTSALVPELNPDLWIYQPPVAPSQLKNGAPSPRLRRKDVGTIPCVCTVGPPVIGPPHALKKNSGRLRRRQPLHKIKKEESPYLPQLTHQDPLLLPFLLQSPPLTAQFAHLRLKFSMSQKTIKRSNHQYPVRPQPQDANWGYSPVSCLFYYSICFVFVSPYYFSC